MKDILCTGGPRCNSLAKSVLFPIIPNRVGSLRGVADNHTLPDRELRGALLKFPVPSSQHATKFHNSGQWNFRESFCTGRRWFPRLVTKSSGCCQIISEHCFTFESPTLQHLAIPDLTVSMVVVLSTESYLPSHYYPLLSS